MTRSKDDGDSKAVDELLNELAELRELDRNRQAHAPGSAAHAAANREVDRRSQELMDRFRDITNEATSRPYAPPPAHRGGNGHQVQPPRGQL
jgi:hypothetical protein